MTAPTPTQLAEAFAAIAPHLTGGFTQVTATLDGLRVEVTDPAAQHRIAATYGLTRSHPSAGHYSGVIRGVIVTVSLKIPTGIIPAQNGRVA